MLAVPTASPLTFHSLRQHFASWFMMRGGRLEALQRIRRDNPDLVLLDLGLPDRDGLRLLEDVRLESNIPIIVVTARAEEEAQLQSLELGADDYVTKPFSLAQLEARIQAILRRGKRRRRPTRRRDESPPPPN